MKCKLARVLTYILACGCISNLSISGDDTSESDQNENDYEATDIADPDRRLDQVLENLGVTDAVEDEPQQDDASWVDRIKAPFISEPNDDKDPAVEVVDEVLFGDAAPNDEAGPHSTDPIDEPVVVQADTQTDTEPTPPSANPINDAKHIELTPTVPATADPPSLPSLSLDDLLRGSSQTSTLHRESRIAQLAKHRDLAVALRTTLEAAAQVADFGQAGAELLQHASLDTVVHTMIATAEREREQQATSEDDVRLPVRGPIQSEPIEPVIETMSGFSGWQPVFVVRDGRGHRIGWRHEATGAHTTTTMGEPWELDADTITVLGITRTTTGRTLSVDVNGEQRDIPLL